MKGLESEIRNVLSDQRELEKLLVLEKKKRGIDKTKLVFIGMADVANYYWCAMKSLLESKAMELAFFASYLEDRISYSFQLGYIDKLPDKEKLLEVGDEITFSDIEKLLTKRLKKSEDSSVRFDAETRFDKSGNKVMVINPSLSPEEHIFYEMQAKSEGIRVANPEEFPALRGEFLQTTKAEQYPTIRWNFDWEDYVVIGVPDGITERFVYEFKSTRNKFLMYYIKPVALAQANLYGYFFGRNTKRVQIHIVEEGVTKTWEEAIDVNHALETLEKFKVLDEGVEPLLPKKWKCKNCKFKEVCELWKKQS